MQANNAIAYMQQQSAAAATYENQLSSGLQIQAPSDNPIGYTVLAQAQTDSLQYATYNESITNATSTLSSSSTALQNVNGILSQAQTLATEGANATSGGVEYQGLADQVNSLVSELLNNANTQVGGSYLFGGTATGTQPFTSSTDSSGNVQAVTYNGSSQAGQALIGPNQTVATESVGSQVFQQSGADVFQALITLRNNLSNPSLTSSQPAMSAALNQSLSAITTAATAIQSVEAQQSSSVTTLGSLQTQVQNLQLAANNQATNVSAVDYPTAIVQLQQQETSLQASMDVSSKILQQNLLNFLQ
jgi:flagellar hook-associated protein 3 FlgL